MKLAALYSISDFRKVGILIRFSSIAKEWKESTKNTSIWKYICHKHVFSLIKYNIFGLWILKHFVNETLG